MQALKALVIFMGVVIVIGVAVVGVTIYNRMNKLGGTAPEPAPAASSASAPPIDLGAYSFGEKRVPLPEGCRVIEMVPAGDRLLLRLGSLPRCNRILVIDLATGAQLGAIDLSLPEQ